MENPSVISAVFSPLVAFAMSRGLTLDEIQDISGVSPEEIALPSARVPERRMVRIWNELFRRFPNEPITIDFVRSAPLNSVAGMAYPARYASTVRQIFQLLIRNQHYASEGCVLSLIEQDDLAHFTVAHAFDTKYFVPNEVLLGICWRTLTEVLELDIKARSVDIGRQVEGDTRAYDAFFGTPVRFDGSEYRLTVDRAILDRPSKYQNQELLSFADAFFRMSIAKDARASSDPDFKTLLDAIVRNTGLGEFGVDAIASGAAMSQRKAQRVAARHGTTLAALIRDARFSRAKRLLEDTQLTLIEVAYFVGYSDDRAFRRAFKNRFGQTPSEFRRKAA